MGSLLVTEDMCRGGSGAALRSVLQDFAPDHVKLQDVAFILMHETFERQFQIAYRRKDGYEGVLKFTMKWDERELPYSVILAKLALL